MRLPLWVAALLVLLVIGYAVPYLLLPNVETWSGAFLFWIVFGIVVWIILVGRVARWNVRAAPPAHTPEPGVRRP